MRAQVAHGADRRGADRVTADRDAEDADSVEACAECAGPEARVGRERVLELREGAHRAAALRDDLDRVRVARGELLLQNDVAGARRHVGRQGRHAALADVEAEDREGRGKHDGDSQSQTQPGPPLDTADEPAPEAALGGVCAAEVPAEDRDAQRVDAVAEQGDQRGEQRERRGDGDDADDDRARSEAAHDRGRDEEHSEQGDDERAAAEEDGPARGRAGGADRRVLREPPRPLLAVAGDDEQRVVDPEREPHPGEHVHGEDGEVELEREQGHDPETDEDRDERHQHRDQAGDDGAEHEHQDDERSGQAERELAVLEVPLRQRVEVVRDRVVAGDRGAEPAGAVGGLNGCHDRLRAGVARDLELDERGMPVGGNGRRAVEVAPRARDLARRLHLRHQAGHERAVGRIGDRVRGGLNHDHVGDRPCPRLVREALEEEVRRLRRLRRAVHVGARGEPVQRGRDQYQRHAIAAPHADSVRFGCAAHACASRSVI